MGRLKFTLTSDQLELLLAFENSEGLGHLAEVMAKDPSVVSRNLQRIAEDYPVLKKMKGRWEITPLGIQINQQTRVYLENQTELLLKTFENKKQKNALFTDKSVLIIVNAQNGLIDSTQEGRNNSAAEKNIIQILQHWRSKNRSVIHVKHASDNPSSLFFRQSAGYEILKPLTPNANEVIIEKTKSSAFADTNLEILLAKENFQILF